MKEESERKRGEREREREIGAAVITLERAGVGRSSCGMLLPSPSSCHFRRQGLVVHHEQQRKRERERERGEGEREREREGERERETERERERRRENVGVHVKFLSSEVLWRKLFRLSLICLTIRLMATCL